MFCVTLSLTDDNNLCILGVLGEKVRCNHIIQVERTLGIEAARQVIMEQVQYVMSNYGIAIDPRHTMLMSDLMTFKVCSIVATLSRIIRPYFSMFNFLLFFF